MNHLMIDVEALRLKQPWWAPLMSVGMVVFNDRAEVLAHDELFVIPGTLPLWAESEPSTVKFWEDLPYYAKLKEDIVTRGEPILDVLQAISTFGSVWGVEATWFAGPTYDQVMLEAYFDGFGLDRPWKYNDTRDFRTIRKQHPEIYEKTIQEWQGMAHCALDDAQRQVRVLRDIYLSTGKGWL